MRYISSKHNVNNFNLKGYKIFLMLKLLSHLLVIYHNLMQTHLHIFFKLTFSCQESHFNIITNRKQESVDTPMVERRKNNWLVRQLSRMGSMRSQSTAYSSGGMPFNRNRLNSVYSSPESGLPLTILQQQQLQQAHQQQQAGSQPSKSSLYGKFVHRKSLRAQRQLIKQSK